MDVHQNTRIVIDGYELGDSLGAGGAGRVYKARQLSTGQTVALKLLHSNDPVSAARFQRERALCAQLQHPHIVRLLDSGLSSTGAPFTVFEYVPGETLASWLLKQGAMPVAMATELMLQVLDALTCIHQQGIVHRDLNPGNIMLTSTGITPRIKLLDFGISALLPAAQDSHYHQITLTTSTLGTPAYSAPEQLRGDSPTEPADIYAWALIFIECLTGSSPLGSGSVAEVIQQQLSPLDIPLPPRLATHPLGALLRPALAKNPQRRTADSARLWQSVNTLPVLPLSGTTEAQADSSLTTEATDSDRPTDDALVTQVIPASYQARHTLTALGLSLSLHSHQSSPASPETLAAVQQELLNQATDIAAQYQGTAQGCLANCLLLTFGYPDTDSGSPRRAITAAQAILQALGDDDQRQAEGLTLYARAGLDSGVAVTGYDGRPHADAISNALRLAQLARNGTTVLGEGLLAALGSKTSNYPLAPLITLGDTPPLQARYLTPVTEQITPRSAAALPFCGRQAELEQLQARWHNTSTATAEMVLITGEAGMGKSRLLHEFIRHLSPQQPRALHCYCYPEQRHQALAPILRLLQQQLNLNQTTRADGGFHLLEQWCSQTSTEPEALRVIICQWLALPTPTHLPVLQYSPLKQKTLLINALINWLQSPAQPSLHSQQTLLTIEDIHWADPTTLSLLNQLTECQQHAPLLVVASSRKTETAAQLTRPTPLHLASLNSSQVKTLITQQLPELSDNPALVEALIERSGGLPLFVEELISLHKANPGEPLNHTVPLSLHQSLHEHLNTLGPELATAQVAACIGQTFSRNLLSRVLDTAESRLQHPLHSLISAGIIQPAPEHPQTYRFRHALLQDAASQSMTRTTFTDTHSLIARVLAAEPASAQQPQRLAYHFANAEQFAEAVAQGIEAASLALGQALNDDASSLVHEAMPWAAQLSGTDRIRAELQLNDILTHVRILSAGWADAQVKSHADHSRSLIAQLGADHSTYASLWSLALYHHVAGDRQVTARLADQLVTLSTNEPTQHCHAIGLRGQCAFIDGDFPRAQQLFQQALSVYEPEQQQQLSLSSVDTKVWSLSQLANLQWLSGWQHQAITTSAEALSWAQRLGHVPSFGIALLYRAMLCQFASDKEATAQVSQALLSLSSQYDLPAYQGYATVLNAWASHDLQPLQEMLSGLRFMGCQLGLSQYDALSADLFLHQGQPQHAVHTLEQCLAFAQQSGEHYYLAELHTKLACVLESMGDEAAARSHDHRQQAADFMARQALHETLTPPAYASPPQLLLPDPALTLARRHQV